MCQIYCLTSKHIYMMHEASLESFGGLEGYYNNTQDKIESVLAQQYPVFGYDKYPGIFLKAAMLMYFFTKGHCFRDGNKRVGVQSAIVFLELNGYEDNLEDESGYQKTMEIASLELHGVKIDEYIEQLAEWLSKRFVKKD